MPSTTETTNLGLTIYQSEDKPTYLVDYNEDMQKIDTAYGEIKTAAESADAKATSAGNLAQAASEAVGTAVDKANCAMSAASSVAGTADSALTKAEGAVTLATSASEQAQAATEKVNQVEAGLLNIDDIVFSSPEFNGQITSIKVVNGVLCGTAILVSPTNVTNFALYSNYKINGTIGECFVFSPTYGYIILPTTFTEGGAAFTVPNAHNGFTFMVSIKWDPSWTKKAEPDDPPKPVVPPTPISPPGNASNMTLTGSGISSSTVKMLNSPPTFTIWFDVTPTEEITAPFTCGTLTGWPGNFNPTSTISGTLSPGGTWSISTAGVLTINPDKAYGSGQHFTGTVSVASWYSPPPPTITGTFTCSNSEGDGSGTYTLTTTALSITGNINIRSTSTASQVIFTFDRALPIASPTGSGVLMYGVYERSGSMTYNSGKWYLPLNPSTSLGRGNKPISWSAAIRRTD